MFDRLFDILYALLDKIIPLVIVKDYHRVALFRFGKFRKVLGPGVHFKIPFFDDPDFYVVATTTLTLPVQSVVTKDGESIVVKGAIKYQVTDVEVFGVKVTDAKDALSDMTCGIIFDTIKSLTWQEAYEGDINSVITKKAKSEAKRWGVTIEKVTVTDLSKMRSLRLFNETSSLT